MYTMLQCGSCKGLPIDDVFLSVAPTAPEITDVIDHVLFNANCMYIPITKIIYTSREVNNRQNK